MTQARILTVDIETSPLTLSGWGLREQNFGLNQILETSRTICFAAKWDHENRVRFHAEWHSGGNVAMLEKAWRLMDEADVLVAHNAPFDVKQLNAAFLLAGMGPPSPFQTVDTLRQVRGRFFLASNRLDHVASVLGFGNKVSHEGHGLWLRVLAGDKQARALMRTYNEQDTVLAEAVYRRLRDSGWLVGAPHMGSLNGDRSACPHCGAPGSRQQSRGVYVTKAGAEYRRFYCRDCGGWSRAKTADRSTAELRGVR
jgi:hypothetical protein